MLPFIHFFYKIPIRSFIRRPRGLNDNCQRKSRWDVGQVSKPDWDKKLDSHVPINPISITNIVHEINISWKHLFLKWFGRLLPFFTEMHPRLGSNPKMVTWRLGVEKHAICGIEPAKVVDSCDNRNRYPKASPITTNDPIFISVLMKILIFWIYKSHKLIAIMITVFTKTVKLVPMLRMNPEKQLHQITNVGFVNRIMNQRQFCLSLCKASSNLQPKENAEKATLQTSFAQTGKCQKDDIT